MTSAAINLAAVLDRSRAALARAITLLENDRPGAAELLAQLTPHCGRAHVVGITGAPGAGKSTLINALLGELTRRGRRVAVVAVDPSSPISGGSILGDRVRMDEHGGHEDVFVRSVSARGHLGGLSRTAGRIIDLFDAAGFDVVIVETVGTGQSEVEIRHFADTSVLVCPPGLGDEVQAIKAGIIEIADLVVVNKADSPLAGRAVMDLSAAIGLRHRAGPPVEVLRTVATTGEGVAALVEAIAAHGAQAGIGRRLASRPAQTAQTAAGTAAAAGDDALLRQVQAWRGMGKGVALATVVRTWGSSPRPEGSHLVVEEGGAFAGSVSGGCIESAVVGEAQQTIADGTPRLLEFGVSDEQAWEVGLACGGRVQVFVERIG